MAWSVARASGLLGIGPPTFHAVRISCDVAVDLLDGVLPNVIIEVMAVENLPQALLRDLPKNESRLRVVGRGRGHQRFTRFGAAAFSFSSRSSNKHSQRCGINHVGSYHSDSSVKRLWSLTFNAGGYSSRLAITVPQDFRKVS